MKLKIEKDILLEGLNKVSKAISTKNLVPVLAGIKFDLDNNGLTLTASDNDITIQTFIENKDNMQIDVEGSIIIQGKYILDIVRKLPCEFINIEVIDDLKILIYTENSEFNLNGISESENPFSIPGKVFKNIVNQTSFAASNDESRPVLTGINFKIMGNILECNSTDSYRLARKVVNLDKEETKKISLSIKQILIAEDKKDADVAEEASEEVSE